MKAYDVIARTLGAKPDPASVRWVDAGPMRHYRLSSSIGLAGCFVCLGGALFSLPGSVQLAGLGLGVACMVVREIGRRSFRRRLAETLDTACDPVLFCRRHLALLAYGRPTGGYVQGIWDHAYGLLWQGAWHQAIALMRTLEADLDDPGVLFVYDSFMADAAFALRDPDKLASYIAAMRAIPDRKVARAARLHAAEMEPLRDLLAYERDGERARARAIVDEILADEGLLPIERVVASLHAAECCDDAAERARLLTFVQERGGTTWCAARARTMAAAEGAGA